MDGNYLLNKLVILNELYIKIKTMKCSKFYLNYVQTLRDRTIDEIYLYCSFKNN